MPTITVGGSAGFSGLQQVADALRKLGDVGPALTAAMDKAGGVVIDEASARAPVASGAMVGTLQSRTDGQTLRVTVGGPAAPYAYTFHAVRLGKSGGYMTFKIPGHSRAGYNVAAYKRVAEIPNNPFLLDAWDTKRDEVFEVYKGELYKVWEGVSH